MKKRLSAIYASLIVTSMLLTACSSSATPNESKGASGNWTPKSEIESVVPSVPGGGFDANARMIADIAFTSGYTPKDFKVSNMPSGSGGVAFSYMAIRKGDDKILMVLHNGQIMSILVSKSPVVTANLTYLSVVTFGNLLLCINRNGKYKSVEKMIETTKANPGGIKIGGSQGGNTDRLCFEMMRKYLDVDITYMQFDSSGETMSALLGGHVDLGIFDPSEHVSQVKAGEVLPMATLTGDRLSGQFAKVRTFKEIGYPDILITEVHALSGTLEMSAEAIAFYGEMARKVTETERWKAEYIERDHLTPVFMASAKTKEFFDQKTERHNNIFREVGVIR